MSPEEMTPKQRKEAERLGAKVRNLEYVANRITNLERDNSEMYEKLKIHEQYLSLMVKLTNNDRDKVCRGEGRDHLWELRKEAEAELYAFMQKPATFDDIEDTWTEKTEMDMVNGPEKDVE